MFGIWDVWDVRCFLKWLKNNAKIFLKIFYSLSQSIFAFSRDSTEFTFAFFALSQWKCLSNEIIIVQFTEILLCFIVFYIFRHGDKNTGIPSTKTLLNIACQNHCFDSRGKLMAMIPEMIQWAICSEKIILNK